MIFKNFAALYVDFIQWRTRNKQTCKCILNITAFWYFITHFISSLVILLQVNPKEKRLFLDINKMKLNGSENASTGVWEEMSAMSKTELKFVKSAIKASQYELKLFSSNFPKSSTIFIHITPPNSSWILTIAISFIHQTNIIQWATKEQPLSNNIFLWVWTVILGIVTQQVI